jgi:hypothetical protein
MENWTHFYYNGDDKIIEDNYKKFGWINLKIISIRPYLTKQKIWVACNH